MDNSFDPHAIERPLYQEWESKGYFAPSGNGVPYCIAIPPPNVTGTLHMGHAFQHTLIDALIRYQRMSGKQTLWQMGTDHAGIATQMLVERQLEAEGKSRHDIGRDGFLQRVWEWRNESGGEISTQLRRMGSSVDWSRDRFTMDEGFSRAVLEVFVRLHDAGLIYRGKRLVNWDPELETAISDLEVENEEENGYLWHFRYPLADGARTIDGKDYLVVATTRPETMLGDTAVAVHPDDKRYTALIGKRAVLPLVDRELEIIADDYVDPEFGTGCVKITPGHDFNDNEIGQRHNLDIENIFTSSARINDSAPAAYRGLDRFEARSQIVADMQALGLVESIEDHKLVVPRAERSGAIVEPWLTDQWFVDIKPLAKPAIEAVESGAIEFIPKHYENVYFAWMRDIRDWCISRQQWWGHQIPAWYDAEGNVYVGRNETEAREKNGLDAAIPLTRDPDVLETWFSSALWTFGTLGWPEATPELEKFHPTDALVTGHDIIFFWVARMIMMTLKFTGDVPFKKVYIHGLVRDADGKKMSKTKGNGIDPLDLIDGISLADLVDKRTTNLTQPDMAPAIEKHTRRDFPDGIPSYGTDALRFTYCALASTGRDVRFDLKRIEGYRNFCNKLWNATKFVLMNTDADALDGEVEYSVTDRWIRSRASELITTARRAIDSYRFDLYANAVYEFAWHEYCDWYLELTKPILWDESTPKALARGSRRTLLEVMDVLLRTAHPIIPFITETLWQRMQEATGGTGETIMLQAFPHTSEWVPDPDADAAIEWLKGVIIGIRNIRGEMNIKPATEINVLLQDGDQTDRDRLAATEVLLKRLAKIDRISWLEPAEESPPASVQLVGDLKVMVPFAGLIDVDAERARLNKEIEKLTSDLTRIEGKLANEKFVAKAPPEIVQKERDKHADLDSQMKILAAQLVRLRDL
ncbi:MAG: valine--tRNA ligase [Gammaproteobacteria bacterium]|nr:valine--tRNA ligase [Gammaproteobacteria bacterium]